MVGIMVENYVELETGFTTADTVGPVAIGYADRRLTVSFANWGTPVSTVVFHGVPLFKWDVSWPDDMRVSPDRVYRVDDSQWLAAWLNAGGFAAGDCLLHFKLGFVAEAAFLDVLALRMEQVEGPLGAAKDELGEPL